MFISSTFLKNVPFHRYLHPSWIRPIASCFSVICNILLPSGLGMRINPVLPVQRLFSSPKPHPSNCIMTLQINGDRNSACKITRNIFKFGSFSPSSFRLLRLEGQVNETDQLAMVAGTAATRASWLPPPTHAHEPIPCGLVRPVKRRNSSSRFRCARNQGTFLRDSEVSGEPSRSPARSTPNASRSLRISPPSSNDVVIVSVALAMLNDKVDLLLGMHPQHAERARILDESRFEVVCETFHGWEESLEPRPGRT